MTVRGNVIYKYAIASFIFRATPSYTFLIQNSVHTAHKVSWTISQSKSTSDILVVPKRSSKGCDLLAIRLDQYLPETSFKISCTKIGRIT